MGMEYSYREVQKNTEGRVSQDMSLLLHIFSPDSMHIVSVFKSRTVQIWSAVTGKELIEFVPSSSYDT